MTTTTQRPIESAALKRYEFTLGKFYKKIFNDRPELSIRVRVLVAVATVWASLSLYFIGVSPIIPLLTIVGHLIAKKSNKSKNAVDFYDDRWNHHRCRCDDAIRTG